MAWGIELTREARQPVAKLDRSEAKRIGAYSRYRLEPLDNPRCLGKPLEGKLGEPWRYRVWNYRLVCKLQDEVLVVLVVRIGKRSEVYHQ